MQTPSFDPGLTQKYTGQLRRAINSDGTFNVVRRGAHWQDIHPYLALVRMSWLNLLGVVLLAYFVMNVLFAVFYFWLGPDALQGGLETGGEFERFLKGWFFSSQTLTTVGFGSIAPRTDAANAVAAVEAFVGVLGFAIATGLVYGRISRPSARIGFSEKAMMTPYQDGHSFQFRIVNRRSNTLMELEATVLLMTVRSVNGELRRDFQNLALEREKVMFFPLTWTVVHPVNENSPLHGKTLAELEEAQAEFLVLVKAWDETFSQTVHQRFSYRYDDIVWDARFAPAFTVSDDGNLILDVGNVGAFRPIQ